MIILAAMRALKGTVFGVEGDIQSVGEFIRLYLSRHERWASPLFLVGESYGTTRAAGDKRAVLVRQIVNIERQMDSGARGVLTVHFRMQDQRGAARRELRPTFDRIARRQAERIAIERGLEVHVINVNDCILQVLYHRLKRPGKECQIGIVVIDPSAFPIYSEYS